jgi:hypothetical protein
MRIDNVYNALFKLFATGVSVELISGPGIGKSSIVEAVAKALSVKLNSPVGLMAFMLSTISSVDVGGFMIPTDDRWGLVDKISTFSLPPTIPHPHHFARMSGGAYKVFINGEEVSEYDGVPKYGIVFYDEFKQAENDVRKAAADMLLNKQIRGNKLPKGWVVWCASNRTKDRSGANKELAFITNRRMEIVVEAALDPWVDWALENGVHPVLIAWAKWKPGVVFVDEVPEIEGPFCTPRTLAMLSNVLTKIWGADNFPVDELSLSFASGLIGEGPATELMAFMKMASKLPTFEEIVADPKKTPVPTDAPDAILAICQSISHRVDPDTAQAAFEYITRLPSEFQVMTLKETIKNTPAIVNNAHFSTWLQDHKELVLVATAAKA